MTCDDFRTEEGRGGQPSYSSCPAPSPGASASDGAGAEGWDGPVSTMDGADPCCAAVVHALVGCGAGRGPNRSRILPEGRTVGGRDPRRIGTIRGGAPGKSVPAAGSADSMGRGAGSRRGSRQAIPDVVKRWSGREMNAGTSAAAIGQSSASGGNYSLAAVW